eukprot:6272806-Amphidinium_carterae.1
MIVNRMTFKLLSVVILRIRSRVDSSPTRRHQCNARATRTRKKARATLITCTKCARGGVRPGPSMSSSVSGWAHRASRSGLQTTHCCLEAG